MKRIIALSSLALILNIVLSCGGGGGSGDGATTPARNVSFLVTVEDKDPDTQGKRTPYPGYNVCVFGTCGVTNDRGEAMFVALAPAGAVGMNFTVSGPEFNSIVGFPLKNNATDVDAIFLKPVETNQLEIGQVKFDGVIDPTISAAGFNDGD